MMICELGAITRSHPFAVVEEFGRRCDPVLYPSVRRDYCFLYKFRKKQRLRPQKQGWSV